MTKSYYVYFTPVDAEGRNPYGCPQFISVYEVPDAETAVRVVQEALELEPWDEKHTYTDFRAKLNSIDLDGSYGYS